MWLCLVGAQVQAVLMLEQPLSVVLHSKTHPSWTRHFTQSSAFRTCLSWNKKALCQKGRECVPTDSRLGSPNGRPQTERTTKVARPPQSCCEALISQVSFSDLASQLTVFQFWTCGEETHPGAGTLDRQGCESWSNSLHWWREKVFLTGWQLEVAIRVTVGTSGDYIGVLMSNFCLMATLRGHTTSSSGTHLHTPIWRISPKPYDTLPCFSISLRQYFFFNVSMFNASISGTRQAVALIICSTFSYILASFPLSLHFCFLSNYSACIYLL